MPFQSEELNACYREGRIVMFMCDMGLPFAIRCISMYGWTAAEQRAESLRKTNAMVEALMT
eukprot:11998468-Alexandrium_andersonii.AAC.1